MEASRSPAKLIIYEGINGSGKTTRALDKIRQLEQSGVRCQYLHLPYYRTMPYLREMLARDDLSDHEIDILNHQLLINLLAGEAKVVQLLSDGITVVVDRWWWSYNIYGAIRHPDDFTEMWDGIDDAIKVVHYCRCQPAIAYHRITERDGASRYSIEQLTEQSDAFDHYLSGQ